MDVLYTPILGGGGKGWATGPAVLNPGFPLSHQGLRGPSRAEGGDE